VGLDVGLRGLAGQQETPVGGKPLVLLRGVSITARSLGGRELALGGRPESRVCASQLPGASAPSRFTNREGAQV
jgi:hypothetical protein